MTTLEERPPVKPEAISDEVLEETWEDSPGIVGFLTTVDHKRVGMRYIYTAFAFFFVAGLLALVMRGQLAQPDAEVLSADTYNQYFTMHGTTMIFLFNTPVLAGFGNYLLPLMLGSRDVAFPRLNAFSYWIFVLSGLFIYSGFAFGEAPDGGWFAYTPLTGPLYSPGFGLDLWGLGVIFVGISTTVGAINFIVTAFKMRAPGMRVDRLPIFVWSILGFAFMILFAVPVLTAGVALLEADRLFGTSFYAVGGGGSPLLYQHLFWFWGHPEVYILFLPATGMISTIIPVAARRRLVGYLWVATSLVAIAFISFGVWVHHMFATGMPVLGMSYFSAVSLIIAIPSGIQFFCWIATFWGGRITFHTPMLFCIGFLVIFLMGGVTGVMVAVLPFDTQVHDSYFVVAHFHYVLNGAVVFPIFGAIYWWWPKMTGRMLSERLGRISFWVMFISFHLTFFPMHILGLLGMPRRIYTYAPGLGWGTLNVIISLGGVAFGIGTGISLFNVVRTRWRGTRAPADPWGADTLEWSTPSPTPEYNFAEVPVVAGRHPLWDDPTGGAAPDALNRAQVATLGRGPAAARRTPITEGEDPEPIEELEVIRPTYLPLLVALAVGAFFVGLLITAEVAVGAAVLGLVVGIAMWAWRTEGDLR